MNLTDEERAWYAGEVGEAMRMAARILVDMGDLLGADRLVPIASAHIDGCLYHGDSGVYFAEALVSGGGKVRVPTSLNVGSIDRRNPAGIHLSSHTRDMAERLMRAYVEMGCAQTWTCAPYQTGHRPALGEDVAWAESNAVVFANSVLGARTNRYGDFLDICAALTGRAPRYGLHVPENRRATVVVRTSGLSDRLKQSSAFYPVLGAWLGETIGSRIAVIADMPAAVSEDHLKALGASAASTGAVGLFHVAGVTPEAPTLADACGSRPPLDTIDLTPAMVAHSRDSLSTRAGGELDVVALGSPHYSLAEIDRFEALRQGRNLKLPVYLCTSQLVYSILDRQGRAAAMTAAGVRFVTDTCVVVTPILPDVHGALMTDSGKFAHYTPQNTGYGVLFGSVGECVESAAAGHVVRDDAAWV